MSKPQTTRRFVGNTDTPLDYSSPETLAVSKQERHFMQRMLRAYLRGSQYFRFGFETIASRRVAKEWKVMQENVKPTVIKTINN